MSAGGERCYVRFVLSTRGTEAHELDLTAALHMSGHRIAAVLEDDGMSIRLYHDTDDMAALVDAVEWFYDVEHQVGWPPARYDRGWRAVESCMSRSTSRPTCLCGEPLARNPRYTVKVTVETDYASPPPTGVHQEVCLRGGDERHTTTDRLIARLCNLCALDVMGRICQAERVGA